MKTWIAITIAVSALAFQTMVLHPWHNELDQEFNELREYILKREEENRKLAAAAAAASKNNK